MTTPTTADDDAPSYRACDNCGITYRRELTSHFEDSSAGETTACWSCLGYSGIAEQVLECVEVVEYPAEMGPFYCEHCAADDSDGHERGCERFCQTHRAEVDEDGCHQCYLDDKAEAMRAGVW